MPWILVVALVGAVAYAVGASNHPPEPISVVPAPPAHPGEHAGGGEAPDESPEGPAGAGQAGQETLTGTILEAKDVSQYTYLRLSTGDGETWAAVYRAPVAVGSKVTVEHATALHDFHSRELARDFDTIWFGTLPGHETAPGASGSSPPSRSPSAAPSGAAAGSLPRVGGAMTIAEVAKKAGALEGKPVTVVGTVVKVNDGIMGRNWIHLQDGTGSAASKTNDLLVTTDDSAGKATLGAVVVATGTVKTKQDFGSGYAYDFMLEQASVAQPPGK